VTFEYLAQCQFPPLAEPYDSALREAVAHILLRFQPVGIIASGTIIRGNPGPSSDLDLYVIHQDTFRQRIQRLFNGVPAEIFVNTPQTVRGYFEDEHRNARPITAHMLATGFVVLNRDPVVARLRQEAEDYLDTPPNPTVEQLRWFRYLIGSQYEDARDVADKDAVTASLILRQAVYEMLRYRFRLANRFLPRDKDLLGGLDELDATLAELARSFYGTTNIKLQLDYAAQIAERTVRVTGFFEWESEAEKV